jgi:transposase
MEAAMKIDRMKILELYDKGRGLSISGISKVCGHSRNTVTKIIRAAKEADLTNEKLAKMDSSQIDQLLTKPAKPSDYEMPDFEMIQKEIDTYSGVSLKLTWYEYHRSCKEKNTTPYRYSRFCELFKEWSKKNNVTRRIIHRPGYAMQVDYAGNSAEVIDRVTGEITKAYFFVATFPYSGRMFVEACPNMKTPSWIGSHVRALRFFGGVPQMIVIDNLKVGVTKTDRYEPIINASYAEMASYYNTTIVPARVYYAKGKAQVERTVQIIETWVVAYLRHRTFFSFAELNEAIYERIGELNAKTVTGKEASRDDLFFEAERAHLRPLPSLDYECAEWKKAKLAQDSHFQLERQRYSAPYTLIGSVLDIRITSTTIEGFSDGSSVCLHRRLVGRIGQYSTKEEHMPDHLRSSNKTWSKEGFIRWAEKVGPATARAVSAILASKPVVEQAYRSCRGILALAEKKGPQLIERACAEILELTDCPSYTQIRNIAATMETSPITMRGTDDLCESRLGDTGFIRDPSSYTLRRNHEA